MVEAGRFREGMRRLAASVCVITTGQGDDRHGCTATAVSSVSDNPPSLLVCLNLKSATGQRIAENGRFAVNVLSADDAHTASRFASSVAGKFEVGEWLAADQGAQRLATSVVAFDCKVSSVVPSGSHLIVIGEILAIDTQGDPSGALLYVDGSYGGFAPCAQMVG